MPGPGWRRLDLAELAPLDDLEAALLAVVRGQLHGATLQQVAGLLGGRPTAAPGVRLPGALPERRVCALDAQERVDRAAMLALWALAQPLARVVEVRLAPRAGGEVVWADAVLRVARDDGRPVIVGTASVGWAITDDRIAAWLGVPLEELPELLVAADPAGTRAGLLWCCHGPGAFRAGRPDLADARRAVRRCQAPPAGDGDGPGPARAARRGPAGPRQPQPPGDRGPDPITGNPG